MSGLTNWLNSGAPKQWLAEISFLKATCINKNSIPVLGTFITTVLQDNNNKIPGNVSIIQVQLLLFAIINLKETYTII